MKYIFYFILLPALLPVFIVLRYVYTKDKVEREPLWLVIKVLILGAVFALPCIPVEKLFGNIIDAIFYDRDIIWAAYENVLGIALVEEFSKWLVLMIFIWNHKEFNYRYDGIVYAVTVSLGFAGLENILYVIRYGTGVSISRAIFSIPGHATFGVFMGYYLSRAKACKLRDWTFLKVIELVFSMLIPTVIHGIYDFLLSEPVTEIGMRNTFILYVIILDIFAWLTIKHDFRTDRPLDGARRLKKLED